MRAVVLEKFGGLDSLVYKDIPEPEPKTDRVVIQIKVFGINHTEMRMRRSEWAEAAEVSVIECVGLVKSCPGGEFLVGKVAASRRWVPHDQRQLRRIYPRASFRRRTNRIGSAERPMTATRPPPFFIADNLGLDFLNSIAVPVDTKVEWLGG
jgi:hypothetical protein